ncbi:nucleolar protein 9-like isoform X2 [Argopecten irradians]
MLTDRFASHVLQNTLTQVPRCLQTKMKDDGETEENLSVEDLFLDLCCYIKDNLASCLDGYSSHIVRVIIQILAGVTVDEQVIRSRLSRNQRRDNQQNVFQKFEKFDPPHLFPKMLKKLTKQIFEMDDFKECLCSPTINPVIQTLLLVYHQKDKEKGQKYLYKVLKISELCTQMEEDASLPQIATNEIGSFLVEQILSVGSEEVYRDIYKKVFKGKLIHYALHPVSNFILQKLLTNVKEKELFEEMFEELSVLIEDLLALNHLGVVTRMAETCLRLGCRQEKLVRCIMGAFHCVDPVERQTKLSPLLLSLSTYEVYFGIEETAEETKEVKTEEKEKTVPVLKNINYHGSVLMQNLLRFGNPKVVVSGILELTAAELRTLACDPCGSHVIDVFCQSPSMGEKSRDLLFKRMKGTYMDVACDKNGSRTLDNMWKCATLTQKLMVAEELGRNEAKLQGDRFGFYVHKNCGIFHYKHRLQEWKEVQGQSQKKRKLFSEIINDGPAGKKTKGKEKGWKGTPQEGNYLQLDMDDEPSVSGGNQQSKQTHKYKDSDYQIKDEGMKNLLSKMSDTSGEKTFTKYKKKKNSK